MLKSKSLTDIRENTNVVKLPRSYSAILITKYKVVKFPLNNKLFVQNLDGLIAKLDISLEDNRNNYIDPFNLDIINDVLHGLRYDYKVKWIRFE